MRICLVSREYPPEFLVGGIGTYTSHVGRALAGRGHEVHVVTETAGGKVVGTQDGVVVHRLPRPSGRLKELRLLARSRAVAGEVRSIGGLDVVQACEYAAEGYHLAGRSGTPLVTRLATPRFLIDEIEGRKDLRARLVQDRLERTQTIRSRAVISSTKALAARVGRAWGMDVSSIRVVPNALDIAHVRKLGEATSRGGPPSGSPYVVYFGRLEERKGVHLLAAALAPILGERRDLHVVMAGADRPYAGGSMRGFVEETLRDYRDRVVIHDLLPPDRLLPIVAGATVAILPSLWEAFGFVVLEAMALSVPVLATSGSGFAEIVEDGRSGILVPPGDAGAIETRLRALLADAGERGRLAAGGAARAEEFDTSRICERLEAVYDGLVLRESRSGAVSRGAARGKAT